MKFAAIIEYLQDAEKVGAIRPQHRVYLSQLSEQGKLVASGPFLDNFGALIIYEAPSVEEAEQSLKGDPFHAAGIFLKWTIRPWKMVIANSKTLQIDS